MRIMDIGRLNKRLRIMKMVEQEDDMNQTTQTLGEVCTVWGSLYPIRGIELYEIQKIQSKITHKCYVRYRQDIDTTCHIEYGGRVYSIETVLDVDLAHKMLEIQCVEYNGREEMLNG